jgi:hypothetical protein
MADADFWPATGDNDMSERHLTHQLATALAKEGYHPYWEVSCRGGRIDLVMVRWQGAIPRHVIVAEAKLLYSNDTKVRGFAGDIKKLRGWRPNGNSACLLAPTTRLVVASTWVKTAPGAAGRIASKRSALIRWWHAGGKLPPQLSADPSFRSLQQFRAKSRESAWWVAKAATYESESESQYLCVVAWS